MNYLIGLLIIAAVSRFTLADHETQIRGNLNIIDLIRSKRSPQLVDELKNENQLTDKTIQENIHRINSALNILSSRSKRSPQTNEEAKKLEDLAQEISQNREHQTDENVQERIQRIKTALETLSSRKRRSPQVNKNASKLEAAVKEASQNVEQGEETIQQRVFDTVSSRRKRSPPPGTKGAEKLEEILEKVSQNKEKLNEENVQEQVQRIKNALETLSSRT